MYFTIGKVLLNTFLNNPDLLPDIACLLFLSFSIYSTDTLPLLLGKLRGFPFSCRVAFLDLQGSTLNSYKVKIVPIKTLMGI
jgi:hypothetical protein